MIRRLLVTATALALAGSIVAPAASADAGLPRVQARSSTAGYGLCAWVNQVDVGYCVRNPVHDLPDVPDLP